jgi:hypothetical protein
MVSLPEKEEGEKLLGEKWDGRKVIIKGRVASNFVASFFTQ